MIAAAPRRSRAHRLAHHRAQPGDRRAGERGETLLELMATVVLMGTAIIAVIGMLTSTVLITAKYRAASRANLTVHQYAESLKQPVGALKYKNCATRWNGANPYPALSDIPKGYIVRVETVQYWNGTLNGTSKQLGFTGTCPTTGDKGIQRLTILVQSSSNVNAKDFAIERLNIIKRDQRCPVPAGQDPATYEAKAC